MAVPNKSEQEPDAEIPADRSSPSAGSLATSRGCWVSENSPSRAPANDLFSASQFGAPPLTMNLPPMSLPMSSLEALLDTNRSRRDAAANMHATNLMLEEANQRLPGPFAQHFLDGLILPPREHQQQPPRRGKNSQREHVLSVLQRAMDVTADDWDGTYDIQQPVQHHRDQQLQLSEQ